MRHDPPAKSLKILGNAFSTLDYFQERNFSHRLIQPGTFMHANENDHIMTFMHANENDHIMTLMHANENDHIMTLVIIVMISENPGS